MRGYIVQSKDTGRYVAYPGGNSSYTRDILNARRFATREDAKRNACGNERIIDLSSL